MTTGVVCCNLLPVRGSDVVGEICLKLGPQLI